MLMARAPAQSWPCRVDPGYYLQSLVWLPNLATRFPLQSADSGFDPGQSKGTEAQVLARPAAGKPLSSQLSCGWPTPVAELCVALAQRKACDIRLPGRTATHVTAVSTLAACNPLPNAFCYGGDKRWPVAWPLGALQVGNVQLKKAACAHCLPSPASFVFSRNYLFPRSSSEGLGVGLGWKKAAARAGLCLLIPLLLDPFLFQRTRYSLDV